MKILFTRFPLESALGGAERQTISLMKAFMAKGHAVAFVGSCPVLLELCREEQIICAELDIGKPPVTKWGAISFVWRRKKMQKALESAIAEFGSLDVVCMLSLSEKILLTESATKRGIKVFWIEHDRIGRWLTNNPWLNDLLSAAKHATTIAVSKLTKEHYIRIGWPKDRIVDIVNGVDEQRLQGEASSVPSPLSSVLTLGCVARLSPDKGVDVLLAAIENLPDVDLHIVGQGWQEPVIRQMIAKINRHDERERVTLVPSVEHVGEFYRSVDALVLPSPQEDPCPLAPMEAMMVGTPVIMTDACGTAGYVENGNDALIVKANSIDELREAIIKLNDEPLRKKLSSEGMKTAQTIFSLDRMVDHYLHTFTR
jgi:glycosyltransferase involved in cell wall biosynthesis